MKKNKYLILSCITLLSFIITLQAIPLATCLTTTINDGQNDVVAIKGIFPSDQGNFIDEIDIVKLDIDGQEFNLTLGGDLESISFNHSWIEVHIMIFETFNTSKSVWDQWQYGIMYYPYTDYEVQLAKHIPFNGGYSHDYWNGNDFNGIAVPIGVISGNLISAYVPEKALNISDTFTFIVETQYGNWAQNQTWYYDCMPDQYAEYSVLGGIPGYSIFIVLGAIFGVTVIMIKKRSK
ncbi:MAG: hypothetical protein WBH31_02600 [Promethearchaeia archaeon]